jgi:hypothetical protein
MKFSALLTLVIVGILYLWLNEICKKEIEAVYEQKNKF